jgi:hypothetical protein
MRIGDKKVAFRRVFREGVQPNAAKVRITSDCLAEGERSEPAVQISFSLPIAYLVEQKSPAKT